MSDFDWSKEAEKQWNSRAQNWRAKSRDMWDNGSRKDIIPFFTNYVEKGSAVCDLGCGDGIGSLKLAEAGYEVTGIDVSEEMIQMAEKNNAGSSGAFLKGDIASLSLPDDAYEAVMAINSLEWTGNPLEVLMQMQRIVKQEGVACVGILGPTAGPRASSFNRLRGEQVICNTMMPWEFEQLASEIGWEKIGEFGVFKKAAEALPKGALPLELRQALSFMWVFILKNRKGE